MLLLVFLCIFVIVPISYCNTNIQTLDTKIDLLTQKIALLQKQVDSSSEFCATLPAETCGPCVCRDDRRTLKKYYCDCQNLDPKRDCQEFYRKGVKIDGLYKINQLGLKTLQVFCDQTTDGGGWTVIQRRIDGSENFYRDWESYKSGFGDLQHEHWLGNDNIHIVDLQSRFGAAGSEVRIDMMTWKSSYYAKYSTFQVGNEVTKYKLHLKGYSGNAGDKFSDHNGAMFSTIDEDNDKYSGHCSQLYSGGWWFIACHPVNLNGRYYYLGKPIPHATGILWYDTLTSATQSLKRVEMKMRRKI